MPKTFYVPPLRIDTGAFLADSNCMTMEEFGAFCRALFKEWKLKKGRWRGRETISPQMLKQVHERDGECCSYCLTFDGPFEIDHIDPVNRGGKHEIDNLCVACRSCNRRKTNKTLLRFIAT